MNIAEELSYLTLGAACAGSLYLSNSNDMFFLSVSGITLLYAILGALKQARIGDSNQRSLIEKTHEQLIMLLPLTVLPSLVTEVWLRYRFGGGSTGMVHSGIGVLTSFMYNMQSPRDERLIDGMVGIEGASLLGVGLYMENYYAAAAAVLFVAAYYLMHHYDRSDLPLPKEDLCNYLLAGFVVLALRSMKEKKCPLI